jgi:hypothetical protein
MTATDELRRMLDERGVEWDGESYDGVTFWNDETNLAVASDDRDGKLWMSLRVTPEQAIEATLGRGTCHDSNNRFNAWQCSECGATLLLMVDDYGEPSYCVEDAAAMPRYCPNCGRRVVAGDA